MLDFGQIQSQYPESLHGFKRAIVREYLQYKILQGLFESNLASKISFLGGTALRIVYGNRRFSEDIDLDNFGLSWEDFERLISDVVRLLELEGFVIEVDKVAKSAFNCTIKFPDVLYKHGLSPLPQEKIRIQIDTVSQGFNYRPDMKILNKFDVFTRIRVTPLSVLLSQKIYTAANRTRPKGRDFYDIIFLLGQTKPNYDFLKLKIGVDSPGQLREWLLEHIEDMDFVSLTRDVENFLHMGSDKQRVTLFREYWEQADLD